MLKIIKTEDEYEDALSKDYGLIQVDLKEVMKSLTSWN